MRAKPGIVPGLQGRALAPATRVPRGAGRGESRSNVPEYCEARVASEPALEWYPTRDARDRELVEAELEPRAAAVMEILRARSIFPRQRRGGGFGLSFPQPCTLRRGSELSGGDASARSRAGPDPQQKSARESCSGCSTKLQSRQSPPFSQLAASSPGAPPDPSSTKKAPSSRLSRLTTTTPSFHHDPPYAPTRHLGNTARDRRRSTRRWTEIAALQRSGPDPQLIGSPSSAEPLTLSVGHSPPPLSQSHSCLALPASSDLGLRPCP